MRPYLGAAFAMVILPIFSVIYLVSCFPIVAFLLLLNKERQAHKVNTFFSLVGMILAGIRFKVHGTLPQHPPFIIVANHHSYLDILLLHVIFWHWQLKFIGKKELVKIPFWGWTYQRMHIIVDRKSVHSGAKSLQASKEALKKGISVVVFPEGTTRKPVNTILLPFKNGAFALSAETQVAILPVALLNTARVLKVRPFPQILPGKVEAIIGEVIPPPKNNPRAIIQCKEKVYLWLLNQLQNARR